MPSEFKITYTGEGTPYVIVRDEETDDVYRRAAGVFEVWSDDNLALYALPLQYKGGDLWTGEFPDSIPAGDYRTVYSVKEGASYALDDLILSTRSIRWNGATFVPVLPAPPSDAKHRAAHWIVTIPPANQPIDGTDATRHLRISYDEANSETLAAMIEAATDYAEERMGCSLVERTILATFYDGQELILPRGPVIQVLSVIGFDNVESTAYEIKHIGNSARVLLTSSLVYPISISYRAGYTSIAAIPASIRLALKAHVGTMYENRESVSEKGKTVVPHSLDAFYRLKGRTVGMG